jgi:hypothetical protein
MTKVSPIRSAKHPATVANNTIRFYLANKRMPVILMGIQKMQARDDITGKFARKLGQQRRAITAAMEEVQRQQGDLLETHKERYPEGHPQAGQPTPVYAKKPDGSALFKQDKEGKDTDEREIDPNQFNLVDPKAYNKDLNDLYDEISVVECPAFLVHDPGDAGANWQPELDRFKTVNGGAFDACMDLEEDADTTIAPDGVSEPAAEPAGAASDTEDRGAP